MERARRWMCKSLVHALYLCAGDKRAALLYLSYNAHESLTSVSQVTAIFMKLCSMSKLWFPLHWNYVNCCSPVFQEVQSGLSMWKLIKCFEISGLNCAVAAQKVVVCCAFSDLCLTSALSTTVLQLRGGNSCFKMVLNQLLPTLLKYLTAGNSRGEIVLHAISGICFFLISVYRSKSHPSTADPWHIV